LRKNPNHLDFNRGATLRGIKKSARIGCISQKAILIKTFLREGPPTKPTAAKFFLSQIKDHIEKRRNPKY
jgi:hypothetical protein